MQEFHSKPLQIEKPNLGHGILGSSMVIKWLLRVNLQMKVDWQDKMGQTDQLTAESFLRLFCNKSVL